MSVERQPAKELLGMVREVARTQLAFRAAADNYHQAGN